MRDHHSVAISILFENAPSARRLDVCREWRILCIPFFTKAKVANIRNNITSSCALTPFVNLREVNCRFSHLTDIEPLKFLRSLRILDVSYNHDLSSLDPLRHTKDLQVLSCCCTEVTSLEPLSGHTQLLLLDITSSMVAAIPSNNDWVNVQVFRCGYCIHLRSLKGLESMRNLRALEMERLRVKSLAPVGTLEDLRILNCSKCHNLTSLKSLLKCTKIEAVNFCYTYNEALWDMFKPQQRNMQYHDAIIDKMWREIVGRIA